MKKEKYIEGAILALKFLFRVDSLPKDAKHQILQYRTDGDNDSLDFCNWLGMNFDIPPYFTITGMLDCYEALIVSYSESDPEEYPNLKITL